MRSIFRFAAYRHPEHAELIARVLAIPAKRSDRALVTFPTRPEIDALHAAPDRDSWTGRRDYALLVVAGQIGLRASKLVGMRRTDVVLGHGAHRAVKLVSTGARGRVTGQLELRAPLDHPRDSGVFVALAIEVNDLAIV